ncbi:MarR family transcriptional regulator [Longispora fulva]|uniref:DNA-binding MarR family transcriptional regulator n=1 Tax=Longispora fulva TaxID=619741 RepID=A0A8J7GJD2_9ACTN|nr:MarR family winged helix-turn-helix transcriptional regulator [Longispora fulva]MBG6137618.1 DNA-binding MarR family transcriptional regulator [Longispora fulva]GIG62224.1 MarR family transcriptional regulator [Longispora fulva]
MESGYSEEEAAELLTSVGPAFRKMRRTVLTQVENPVPAKDLSRTLVLTIVEEGDVEGEVTVGAVAASLAVDPSVASRMVSDCISAGYLVRAASQRDGRRTILQLSDEGVALLGRFREQQREAFLHITADWTERDRLDFARLVLKYVDSIGQLRDRATPN